MAADETSNDSAPDSRRSLTASESHSLTAARHLAYWDYDADALLTCPACGWNGPGRGAEESFTALLDVRCPKCECILLVVMDATDEETSLAAEAGNARAIASVSRLAEREALQQHRPV